MHISAAHYLQGSNKLVLKPARSDIFYAPFYSREELMAKAKAILERDVLAP